MCEKCVQQLHFDCVHRVLNAQAGCHELQCIGGSLYHHIHHHNLSKVEGVYAQSGCRPRHETVEIC